MVHRRVSYGISITMQVFLGSDCLSQSEPRVSRRFRALSSFIHVCILGKLSSSFQVQETLQLSSAHVDRMFTTTAQRNSCAN